MIQCVCHATVVLKQARKSNYLSYLIVNVKSQYNLTPLIHLLNIANVIPFIASLGIHFIFINVIIYREKKKNKTSLSKIGKKRLHGSTLSETNLS